MQNGTERTEDRVLNTEDRGQLSAVSTNPSLSQKSLCCIALHLAIFRRMKDPFAPCSPIVAVFLTGGYSKPDTGIRLF